LQQQILIVTAASALHFLSMTHVWHLGGSLNTASSSEMSVPGSAVAVLTVYALARVGGQDCVRLAENLSHLQKAVLRVLPAELVYLVYEAAHACKAGYACVSWYVSITC